MSAVYLLLRDLEIAFGKLSPKEQADAIRFGEEFLGKRRAMATAKRPHKRIAGRSGSIRAKQRKELRAR